SPATVVTFGLMADALLQPANKDGVRPGPRTSVKPLPPRLSRGRVPGPIGTGAADRLRASQIIMDFGTTRTFEFPVGTVFIAPFGVSMALALREEFKLSIVETSRFHYQAFAGVDPVGGDPDRPDRAIVQKFVETHVMPKAIAPIAGIPF